MAEFGEPEEFLLEIDFQDLVTSEDKSLRIGSKAYILALGVMKEEFRLKEIKGDLNNIDKDPEEVRKILNIYSETELENLKRRFLEHGYLEQKEDSPAYTLTNKGFAVLKTYVNISRANQFIKILEFGRLDDQLQLIERLDSLKRSSKDLSDDERERLLETHRETGRSFNNLFQDYIRKQVKQNYAAYPEVDEKIREMMKEIQQGIQYLEEESSGVETEELEEIRSMVKNLTRKPEVPVFGTKDKPNLWKKYDKRT